MKRDCWFLPLERQTFGWVISAVLLIFFDEFTAGLTREPGGELTPV